MSRSPFSARNRPLAWLLGGALAVVLLTLPGADARADDEGSQTMLGEYYWTGGNTGGELKAVFTATGEDTWDVDFFFDFRSKPHVYSGTAEGSLTDGPLEGTVKNENRRRTFVFGGKVVESRFTGEHAEITQDERRTGTLELQLQ